MIDNYLGSRLLSIIEYGSIEVDTGYLVLEELGNSLIDI